MELMLNARSIGQGRIKESRSVRVPKEQREILTTIAVSMYDLMMCYNDVNYVIVMRQQK